MRLLAVTLICLSATATLALAEGWEVMYLAASGGSRPMHVGPNDGGTPFAYVDSARGERLFLDCRTNDNGFYDWTLKLHPGDASVLRPFDSDGTRLFAGFDDDPTQIDLGLFNFVQEAFWAAIPEDVAMQIMERSLIRISDGGSAVAEFTLRGSSEAIDRACPTP